MISFLTIVQFKKLRKNIKIKKTKIDHPLLNFQLLSRHQTNHKPLYLANNRNNYSNK
jgi:hypothetical protein